MSRLNDPPEVHNKTRYHCTVRDFFLSITKAATIYGECAVREGAAPSAVQWLWGITDRMFLVRLNRRKRDAKAKGAGAGWGGEEDDKAKTLAVDARDLRVRCRMLLHR